MRRADQKLRGHCEAEDDEQKQANTAQHAHSDERLVVVWRMKFRQRAWTIEGPEPSGGKLRMQQLPYFP